MNKYINAEKLRSEVERIKKTGCESPISVCNDILSFIDFLQQEQLNVDIEKKIDNYLDTIQAWQIQEAPFTTMEKCARHFYELGQQEMRHRITNPEYNAKVIERLKSEYPAIKEE